MIVSKLSTVLTIPEDAIFHQYETSRDMYIVARGECVIHIRDEKSKLVMNYETLTAG